MTKQLPAQSITRFSHGEDETRQLGAALGKRAQRGQIITLLGDLGAGKTRFAQGFGTGLGVPDDVVINSPTFTLINQYEGRLTCYHIDLYRLSDASEAETLGLDDFLYGDGVSLIEWANRLGEDLPASRLEIELIYLDEDERRLEINAFGEAYFALLDALK